MQNGKPIIRIEVKSATSDLNKEHASQLYRCCSITEVRIGILTNGLDIHAFSQILSDPVRWTISLFSSYAILNMDTRPVAQLKKFAKSAFDVDRILSSAN